MWLVSPSFRTDEQEVNGRTMSHLTTDGIFALPKDWEVRGRFFVIGRDKEIGGGAFDQRVQIRVRHPIGKIETAKVHFLPGMVYERHFRGDAIPDFNVFRPRVDWFNSNEKMRPYAQQYL